MKKNYFDHFNSETLPKVKTYFSRVQYVPLMYGETPKVGVPVAQSTEDPRTRAVNTSDGKSTTTNTTIIYGGNQGDPGIISPVLPNPEFGGVVLQQTSNPFATFSAQRPEIKLELNAESLRQLATLFEHKGVPVRITSLERPGARTSNGAMSHHASGKAIDIVPVDNNFEKLQNIITTDPEVINFMNMLGIGFIDETTEETLRRTGGTGPHYHFGPDKLAIRHYQSFFQ